MIEKDWEGKVVAEMTGKNASRKKWRRNAGGTREPSCRRTSRIVPLPALAQAATEAVTVSDTPHTVGVTWTGRVA